MGLGSDATIKVKLRDVVEVLDGQAAEKGWSILNEKKTIHERTRNHSKLRPLSCRFVLFRGSFHAGLASFVYRGLAKLIVLI